MDIGWCHHGWRVATIWSESEGKVDAIFLSEGYLGMLQYYAKGDFYYSNSISSLILKSIYSIDY